MGSGRANSQAHQTAAALTQVGFTLIELLVVLVIIGLLAALLLPGLSRAKAAAQSARCQSNLRQLGVAFAVYQDDHADKYPPEGILPTTTIGKFSVTAKESMWTIAILPALSQGGGVLFCPGQKGPRPVVQSSSGNGDRPSWSGVPYEYNTQGTDRRSRFSHLGLAWTESAPANPTIHEVKGSQLRAPADMIALVEPFNASIQLAIWKSGVMMTAGMSLNSTNWTGAVHNESSNGLFCDGHVESHKPSRWQRSANDDRRRWNVDNEPHPETW